MTDEYKDKYFEGKFETVMLAIEANKDAMELAFNNADQSNRDQHQSLILEIGHARRDVDNLTQKYNALYKTVAVSNGKQSLLDSRNEHAQKIKALEDYHRRSTDQPLTSKDRVIVAGKKSMEYTIVGTICAIIIKLISLWK